MEFFKKKTNFPFMGTRKLWYTASAIMIVISIGSFVTRGLNLAVDFTGGVTAEVHFAAQPDLDRLRAELARQGFSEPQAQTFGTSRDVLVRLPPQDKQSASEVRARVDRAVKAVSNEAEIKRVEVVGPQVGAELRNSSIWALIATVILIFIYVALRFHTLRLGRGAILAALHDPILVLGFFSVTQMTFDLAVVAAVLAVDQGPEPLNNRRLEAFLREHRYPLDHVPHAFLSLGRGLAAGLAEGERLVRGWLPAAAACARTAEPLSGLRIALQCGGSDAFSGVSGNPLAGALVHEAIRHGATGVLTETDESMGAEDYMLANVRDLATARAFTAMLDRFREKLAWHGLTAESNPSAGNRFRGLYNIALKSLGAVHKKDPRTPLQTLIEYAQPLRDLADPGFTFMNGPGNDLEGIAGQVGAGCNLILFATGNGSITNFPFVPTLKVTTTTRRHELLRHEMDINAGRYLDGEPMEALAAEYFELVVETAGGRRTRGEHAGHAQVSVWRNWRQTDTSRLAELQARVAPDGRPLPVAAVAGVPAVSLPPLRLVSGSGGRGATERLGLILPTSLCSTQIVLHCIEL